MWIVYKKHVWCKMQILKQRKTGLLELSWVLLKFWPYKVKQEQSVSLKTGYCFKAASNSYGSCRSNLFKQATTHEICFCWLNSNLHIEWTAILQINTYENDKKFIDSNLHLMS